MKNINKLLLFPILTVALVFASCGAGEEEEKYKHEFEFRHAKKPMTILGLLDNSKLNALSIQTLKGLGENASGDLYLQCKNPRTYVLESVMMDVENDTLIVFVSGEAKNGFGVAGSVSKSVAYDYKKLVKGVQPYKAKFKEGE